MVRSFGLAAYLALSARSESLGRAMHRRRVGKGKEDAMRIGERFGRASAPRPAGQLAWFHAASVGESVALLELVRALGEIRPELNVLMTTGTLTSARLLETRLPDPAIHQFAPYDMLPSVRRFLDHWQPDIGVWTESELWPAMVAESHARGIPLLLVNARMSRRSFRRWRLLPRFAASLLGRFAAMLAQDRQTAGFLQSLGAPAERIAIVGSLKRGASRLPVEEAELEKFEIALDGRACWLAASTHEGEERMAARAHETLLKDDSALLLVVVPRHPERGPAIARDLRAMGLQVAMRSRGELPGAEDRIYLADTLGELGLWYRAVPVSFVGGSLVEAGGHNPFEPAMLGSAIIHGPHVANFAAEFAQLTEVGGALPVDSPDSLAGAIGKALEPGFAADLAKAAAGVCAGGGEVVDEVARTVLAQLPDTAARR